MSEYNLTPNDIEKLQFLYKDEASVNIELWDTDGKEKYNKNYIYS